MTYQNEYCWCQSGLPFVDCHKGREKEDPISTEELLNKIKKIDSRKECLHPQASSENCNHIISAHTIQKEGALRNISKSGKVIWLDFNVVNLLNEGKPKFRRQGISNASTLNIFCNKHDTKLFRPIESEPFRADAKQIFLYSYRAICREVRGKTSYLNLIPFLKENADRGKNLFEQRAIQDHIRNQEEQVNYGLRDLNSFKRKYDKKLLVNKFSEIKYYLIEFENQPPIVCCGATSPEMDFHGNDIRSIKYVHEIPEVYSFNLECTQNGGFALFSWLNTQKSCYKFVKSLDKLPKHSVSQAIFRYMLEYFENFFMNPDWFEKLNEKNRRYILNRALSYDGRTRNEKSLLDDGMGFVNWKIKGIKTNLF